MQLYSIWGPVQVCRVEGVGLDGSRLRGREPGRRRLSAPARTDPDLLAMIPPLSQALALFF